MTRERPTLVLLAAIVNLLLGGFCMLAGCGGAGKWLLAETVRSRPDARTSVSEYVYSQVPESVLLGLVNSVELLTAGCCLALAGVGLLWMQPWARWLALGYGLLTIGWQMCHAALQVLWVWPAMEGFILDMAWAKQSYSPDELWTIRLAFFGALVLQVGVLGSHALALMMLLGWPSVGTAFAAPGPASGGRQPPEDSASELAANSGRLRDRLA